MPEVHNRLPNGFKFITTDDLKGHATRNTII
jgi:hypothetical protein